LFFFWLIAFIVVWLAWTLEPGCFRCICCHRAGRDEILVEGGSLMEPLPGLMQSADTLTETQTVLVAAPVHLHTTLHTHPKMRL